MHELQSQYSQQIDELVATCHRLSELGFTTSHGGNVSYRVDERIVLVTPTKTNKGSVTCEQVVLVDLEGNTIFAKEGIRPTGETPLHLRILQRRPDLKGLVHAHPPLLTGFAIAGSDLLARPILPEPITEIGPLAHVAYAEPLSDKLAEAFDVAVSRANAFLMKNHGALVGSVDGVWRAVELLEMLEATAYSVIVATLLGKVNELSLVDVDDLENTMRTRHLAMPGTPGATTKLRDLYSREAVAIAR